MSIVLAILGSGAFWAVLTAVVAILVVIAAVRDES